MTAIRSSNRTQRLVLGFFAAAFAVLVLILVAAPDIYDGTLALDPGHPFPAVAFLILLGAFLALLGFGVLRRWRWIFWLILLAFLSGSLRAIASALELTDVLQPQGPTWYVELQAGIGVVQVVIAIAMIAGYRKAGVWGAF
ncbi:MAG: hypothetical protein ABI959_02850 [Candidatus Dormiibacterota bacterium]